jgi:hypothetical protein
LIDVDADGNEQELVTVEVPKGLETFEEFHEWLDKTLFSEEPADA